MDLGRKILLEVSLHEEKEHGHLGKGVEDELQIRIPSRLDRLGPQERRRLFQLFLLAGKMGGQLPLQAL
jgi:hypothetical protein